MDSMEKMKYLNYLNEGLSLLEIDLPITIYAITNQEEIIFSNEEAQKEEIYSPEYTLMLHPIEATLRIGKENWFNFKKDKKEYYSKTYVPFKCEHNEPMFIIAAIYPCNEIDDIVFYEDKLDKIIEQFKEKVENSGIWKHLKK